MKIIFPVYIGALYFFNLIIYPQWYIPEGSISFRCILAGCFIILTYGSFLLARYLVNETEITGQEAGLKTNNWDYKYKLIAGAFCLITHLPFMNLPILTLGDPHIHAGLPALALAKLDSLCARELHISFRLIFSLCLGLMVVLVVWKRKLIRFVSSLKGFSLIIPAGIIYVILLCRFPILENFGKFEHFFRYPVLGKALFFSSYAVFGIHEWVGRAIQIVFLFAGAFYFGEFLQLLSDRKTGRIGYLIYLMFPPFWNLAHQNFLTAGVLFFCVSTAYYLIRYLQRKRPGDIFIAASIMATGIAYKRPIMALLPISFLIILFWLLSERKFSLRELKIVCLSMLLPTILTVIDLLLYSYLRTLYSYYAEPVLLKNLFAIDRLVSNIKFAPFALGWPITLTAIAGAIISFKYRRKLFVLLSIWFMSYWILSCSSTGYSTIRVSLIGYLAIAGFLSVTVSFLAKLILIKKNILILIPLFIILAFMDMHIGPGETISVPKTGNMFLPYDKLFEFINSNKLYNSKIYAPMICEPSHYYMAKYRITDESFLFRKKWDSGSYGRFEDFLSGEEFKYLVVPVGPRTDKIINQFIAPELMKKILDGKIERLVLHKPFKFGSNSLLLFRITPFSNH